MSLSKYNDRYENQENIRFVYMALYDNNTHVKWKFIS